jgi:hypothetical protein
MLHNQNFSNPILLDYTQNFTIFTLFLNHRDAMVGKTMVPPKTNQIPWLMVKPWSTIKYVVDVVKII